MAATLQLARPGFVDGDGLDGDDAGIVVHEQCDGVVGLQGGAPDPGDDLRGGDGRAGGAPLAEQLPHRRSGPYAACLVVEETGALVEEAEVGSGSLGQGEDAVGESARSGVVEREDPEWPGGGPDRDGDRGADAERVEPPLVLDVGAALVQDEGGPATEHLLHDGRRRRLRERPVLVPVDRPIGVVGVSGRETAILGEEDARPRHLEVLGQALAQVLDGPAAGTRLDGAAGEVEQQVQLGLAPVGQVPRPGLAERSGHRVDVVVQVGGGACGQRFHDEQPEHLVAGAEGADPADDMPKSRHTAVGMPGASTSSTSTGRRSSSTLASPPSSRTGSRDQRRATRVAGTSAPTETSGDTVLDPWSWAHTETRRAPAALSRAAQAVRMRSSWGSAFV
ncbi:MAG: hypothetical protein S0880_32985 [Actinomycetota bacterium]|nr:hypothetical protein [Actinomycetota bacterium]